jgi:hypothetical protein
MRKTLFFFLILFFSLSVYGADRAEISILLDTSKSVPPKDFQSAKTTIHSLMDQAGPGTSVNLYRFGTNLSKIESADLNKIQPDDSYTMVYDAAYDAAHELANTHADRKSLLIFTDGYDTKSVTILEDIVSYANREGLALYAVGIGKPNRKVLERMVKLTGGRYFDTTQKDLVPAITSAMASQKKVPEKEVTQIVPAQPQPQVTVPQVQPAQAPVTQPAVVAPPVEEHGFPYLWVIGVAAAVALLGLFVFVVARSFGKSVRTCPTCGRKLESYQTICPDCEASSAVTKQVPKPVPQDGTQELKVSVDSAVADADLIPVEWLERKPVTEEMLSKTFVLMETPMLVVRKGKNLGQTFALNRAFPVSIGRSRVNEIRLDDVTVSSQHCRIVPENGKHVLCDLGSTNGTFLNDKKVNRQPLKEGDTLRVGETQFLYKIEQHRN